MQLYQQPTSYPLTLACGDQLHFVPSTTSTVSRDIENSEHIYWRTGQSEAQRHEQQLNHPELSMITSTCAQLGRGAGGPQESISEGMPQSLSSSSSLLKKSAAADGSSINHLQKVSLTCCAGNFHQFDQTLLFLCQTQKFFGGLAKRSLILRVEGSKERESGDLKKAWE